MSVFPLDVIADEWTGRQRGKVAKDGKAARWGGDGGGFTEDVSPVDGAVRSSRSSLLLLPLFIRVRKRHESQLRDEERRRTVDFFLFFIFLPFRRDRPFSSTGAKPSRQRTPTPTRQAITTTTTKHENSSNERRCRIESSVVHTNTTGCNENESRPIGWLLAVLDAARNYPAPHE